MSSTPFSTLPMSSFASDDRAKVRCPSTVRRLSSQYAAGFEIANITTIGPFGKSVC